MFRRVSISTRCLLSCDVISRREPSVSRMLIWFFLYSFLRLSSSDLMYLLSLSTSRSNSYTMNFSLFFSRYSFYFSRSKRLSAFWKFLYWVAIDSVILSFSLRSLSRSSSHPLRYSLNRLSICLSSSSNLILASCNS